MIKVNIFEIKSKLSAYIERAARGEAVLIYRHNKPVAELRAVEAAPAAPRPIGPLPGRPAFKVSPSFFDPLPDEDLELWEGQAGPKGPPAPRRPKKGSRRGGER